jgi:pimeloyl-ACP methyl ester carboxylesterase
MWVRARQTLASRSKQRGTVLGREYAASMGERLTVEGPAARRLEVEVDGPSDGLVLISHTGTPSGGRLYAPRVRAGAERGIRHVIYSRPGYGGSDRQTGRTVADCAGDVAAIADALGARELLIEGGSGGGPHALACAALLPERVLAAASVAGVAPYDAQGLNWMEGMGQENIEEFGAACAGAQTLASYLEHEAREMLGATGSELHAALGDLLSEVDATVLSGDYAEWLAQSVNAGLAPGIWGWFDDDLAFLKDWGFDVGSIERPVTIWQGAQDRFVPASHGEWLAAHVHRARAHLCPEHGHLSLMLGAYEEILDDLLDAAGRLSRRRGTVAKEEFSFTSQSQI